MLSSSGNMHRVRWTISQLCRKLHTKSHDGPSDTLKRKVSELEKKKRRKNPKKNQLFVDVPESKSFLDTATMPMILIAVGTAIFAKLLMMHGESTKQERIEQKIKNAPPGQGTIRMLSREEWDAIQELRPRTPFESKLARPNARIRTGEPLHMEDVKDWTLDVFTDALTRAEETAKRRTY
ncbi:uncharacterized protein LOC127240106 [Andrographis paniculata]|uniref:uncharacterized protein LOC127240106 n=1 Tax=Andrographis paniculata TaxID=175694 RepID=UPI0021E93915|nr:uncharacterized protein LOC127240106 [Andrographis paniculata]XP_051114533.1 uncharacterized protein LOC127240106 [Andrographis paniculata]